MGALAWIVAPWLAAIMGGTSALSRAVIIALTVGLVWQFVIVVVLIRREQGTLRWDVVREALWLRAPRAPKTGLRGGRTWFVVLVLIAALVIIEAIPLPPHDAGRDMGAFLGSPAGHLLLRGAWGWLALIAVLLVFNTVLGEELLFRGLLLPRMNGAFGRWDWLANGVLFAAYHLHVPWMIPVTVLNSFVLSYPAKRYRSALVGIVSHSAQSVVVFGLALALVLGWSS